VALVPAHARNAAHGSRRVDQDRSGFAGPFRSWNDAKHVCSRNPDSQTRARERLAKVWICAWSGCHFHAARDGNAGRVHFRERQRGRQSTEGSPFGNRAGLFGLGGLRIYIDSNGHAGQTATYTISLTPGGGFNQNVMLPCNGAPAMSTCNMSPNSIPLSGSATVSATVIVIATAPAKGLQPPIAPGGRSGLQTLSQRKTVGWPKREVDDNFGTQEYGRYWRQAPGYSSGYCTQILDNMPAKRGFLPRAGTFGRGTNPPTSVDGVKTSPRGKPKVQPSATWCTPGAENSHL
jgi:hypothetical protein